MKSFFDLWNVEFTRSIEARLAKENSTQPAAEVTWTSVDELPSAQDVVGVALRWTEEQAAPVASELGSGTSFHSWSGSAFLIASRSEVAALLAGVAPSAVDARRASRKKVKQEEPEVSGDGDTLAAQWVEWLREVTAAMPLPGQPARIEISARPQGFPVAPYLLRIGNMAVRIAVSCDLTEKMVGAAEASREASEPADARPGNGYPEAASYGEEIHFPGTSNLDLLLDIEVDASLRFGAREISIRELLDTGPGDVLELDRHITDPVDLVVGDKIVARGEVVLVNGNFGLRVTEVAEPKKCLESVRCLF